MLVGRQTELGLFPGTFVQIYFFIFDPDNPAYEHPMLSALTYYQRATSSGSYLLINNQKFLNTNSLFRLENNGVVSRYKVKMNIKLIGPRAA